MCKRLSKEIVNEQLRNDNRELLLIGDFHYSRSKSLFKCNKCDYEWMAIVSNIINNKRGCPKCGKNRPLSKEIVNERLRNDNRTITLIGEYINSNTKTEFKCNKCEYEWGTTPRSIFQNKINGCPKCTNQILLSKEIINERLQKQNRPITLIGEYISSQKKSLFKCEVCNYEWYTTPNSVVNGKRGCSRCANISPLSKEIINERLQKQNKSIFLIDEYNGANTKVLFKCFKCDNEWSATPNNVLNSNNGCPKCTKYQFNKDKPALLYYIKINHDNKEYYKIGITNRTIRKRFHRDKINNIEVIFIKNYDKGNDAYNHEQMILNKLYKYRYKGKRILKSGGNKEIFIKDIRELINIEEYKWLI